ncbi:MAG: hypothetical protein V9E98_07570 [Candidatus Nanopelagicales bacterium]
MHLNRAALATLRSLLSTARFRAGAAVALAVAIAAALLSGTAISPAQAAAGDGLKVVVVNNNPDYSADRVWVKATGNGAAAQ